MLVWLAFTTTNPLVGGSHSLLLPLFEIIEALLLIPAPLCDKHTRIPYTVACPFWSSGAVGNSSCAESTFQRPTLLLSPILKGCRGMHNDVRTFHGAHLGLGT